MSNIKKLILLLVLTHFTVSCAVAQGIKQIDGAVTEYTIPWPTNAGSSTHELIVDANNNDYLWVTGQNFDSLARVAVKTGSIDVFAMPKGSGPHGVTFDADGNFWVSFEFTGEVARISPGGEVLETIDVCLHTKGSPTPINTNPHAIAMGPDGKTIWFTGKKTSTVGKINPDRSVEHFQLNSVGAVPIYLVAGPDGNMWGTELLANKILRVTNDGEVTEFPIPTVNSRPIAIVLSPDGKSIWFSEEAGHKIARIDTEGRITEYPVPKTQDNMILASLTFDSAGNLWTQSYVDQSNPLPEGPDYIVKLDHTVLTRASGGISDINIRFYEVPTHNSVFHRITQGPRGNIWFTELKADKLGELNLQ